MSNDPGSAPLPENPAPQANEPASSPAPVDPTAAAAMPAESSARPAESPAEQAAAAEPAASAESAAGNDSGDTTPRAGRGIKIGSQRDDYTPGPKARLGLMPTSSDAPAPAAASAPAGASAAASGSSPAGAAASGTPAAGSGGGQTGPRPQGDRRGGGGSGGGGGKGRGPKRGGHGGDGPDSDARQRGEAVPDFGGLAELPAHRVALPNLREKLSEDLAAELEAALGGQPLATLLEPEKGSQLPTQLSQDATIHGRVSKTHRDMVFIDLPSGMQGVVPVRNFQGKLPEAGAVIELVVGRFIEEEGLYQLNLPGGAVDAGDWSELAEGMIVEARVTGHNKGGLECAVGNVRGFMPAGQVSMYRIEDFSTLVGEKMNCLVIECKPDRRNLVLSRRAVLEREKAEAKEKIQSELAEGQVREGVVRSIKDFGAFVDLGGVDGLLHIGQLSWARIKHPSEVLQEGQKLQVKITKIDPETQKISLSIRDFQSNPWDRARETYEVGTIHQGKVVKVADFGAFVELEPGVEGMVHISEIDHGRVFRVTDFLKVDQPVEVKVLGFDPEKRRISLSRKAVIQKAEQQKAAPEPEPEDETPAPPPKARKTPLKGGIARPSGGEGIGLKW